MRIVRPTNPPTMAVIIDTLFYGDQELIVSPAEISKDRVDIVYVSNPTFMNAHMGIINGTPVDMEMRSSEWPVPTLPVAGRAIAKLFIHRCQSTISEGNIVELE